MEGERHVEEDERHIGEGGWRVNNTLSGPLSSKTY